MTEEIVTYGPEGLPRADPITVQEVFELVQVLRFSNAITCMNVFHFGKEAVGGSGAGLVADWAANIVPTWKAQVTQQVTWNSVFAQKIYPGQDAVTSAAVGGTGSITAAGPAPSVAAGLITWRSQLVGRNRRGRTYVAGVRWDSFTTTDYINWNGNGISYLNGIANAILTRYTLGGNPGGYILVVWSRKLLGSLPPDQWRQAASMVTRYTIQNYVGSMGTRRGARGI